MVRVAAAIALLLALGGCQGQSPERAPASGSAVIADDAGEPATRTEEAPAPDDARARLEDPEVPVDPSQRIHELGAISAWQAVIERAQLLARRDQRGVVYGRVGPVILAPGPAAPAVVAGIKLEPPMVPTPYRWLVDDTEGHGALGIRIKLGGRAAEGDRVALGGAWELDAARTWFWNVDAVEPLPPAPATDLVEPPTPVPSHAITTGPAPAEARPISLAKPGDAVTFQIVGPAPTSGGDGWQIADKLGDPPVAVLNLPGERASYGGHDLRGPDERWQLKRGHTYWVRIGRIRKRTEPPALINARTAPVRVI